MEKYNKKAKIVLIISCAAALIGFALPAVNLNISLLGISTDANAFSIVSLFGNSGNRSDGMNMIRQNVLSSPDTGTELITSVAAYYITAILLITILISAFTEKLKKSGNIMLAISLALFIYAGYAISNFTKSLSAVLSNNLGFLASFINISEMIKINLGIGYWLTLSASGCMMVIKIIMCAGRLILKPKEKGVGVIDN